MKKVLLIISNLFVLSSLVGCNSNKPSYTHESKKVMYYDLNMAYGVETNMDFFSHNPYVCYIPIQNYKEYVPTYTMSIKQNGNTFTFRNLLNNSMAYLNGDSGVLKYDSFSKFNSSSEIPHVEIEYPLLGYSKKIEEESSYKEGHSYSINLGDYNLAPIKFDNNYYLPIDVLMLIDPLNSKGTAYYDGDETVTLLTSGTRKAYNGEIVKEYPSSFYEYNYNILAFNVDLFYGLNGYNRPLRYKNNELFTFNKEGSIKTFEKYKSDIVNAKSINDFDVAIDKIFAYEIDDGGHTVVEDISLGTDKTKLPESFNKHPERVYTKERFNEESEARKNAGKEQKLDQYVTGFDTNSDGHNDIGYVTLDKFEAMPTVGGNTPAVLKEANKLFNKNNKNEPSDESQYIKDVVIDLADNGGGATACEGILLSWLCGGKAKQILKDARDESVTTSVYRYDINRDGEFDEGDYLPNDVNIYILTDATFSAACALTFDTYMYTQTDEYKTSGKNIKFIGKPNLGGACSLTGSVMMPMGFTYHMSSNSVGVNWKDMSKTCDEILPISDGWNMSIDQIVNRTGYINPKIKDSRK